MADKSVYAPNASILVIIVWREKAVGKRLKSGYECNMSFNESQIAIDKREQVGMAKNHDSSK